MDRRRFLHHCAGWGVLAWTVPGLSSCSDDQGSAAGGAEAPLPEGLQLENFVVHGRSPWNLETRRDRLTELITPREKVFVRANLPLPAESVLAAADRWSVEVTGVAAPRSFTLAELKALGSRDVVSVLQCSGNGRSFYEHGPSGSPWGVGAAANVRWTGVPVQTVLDACGGAVDDTRFLTGTGGETIPPGLDERQVVVERSVPLAKARADGILAWDLNGQPLTLLHGGPLRLVTPGYYGVNQVKYLCRLAASTTESDAKIQVSSYRVRPVGEKGGPDQPSMWEMAVKSWISAPLGAESLPAGPVTITGVAFSGMGTGGVAQVEVSADGGGTWQPADWVGDDLGPFAWRTWSATVELAAGQHVLACRATDRAGNGQPETRAENERGYGHNGWRDPSVEITVV